jgi:dihydrofolate synthase / folylpolyglutamate synthase
MLSKFNNFNEINKYLKTRTNSNIKHLKYEKHIEKQESFMSYMGNPEKDLNIIHVAGTSGKGSTTTILTNSLISQGFKIGSTISPSVKGIFEKFKINNIEISEKKFVDYFNEIIPALNNMIQNESERSYFEIITGLQFYIFAKEKVDYAVIEVGCGGRLDATNIFIPNKICIINSIGFDHMELLGDTLVKIAGEKAGIIQEKNQVIALSQSQEINQVFIDKATAMKADLDFVIPNFCFENITQYSNKTYFDYIDQDLMDRQIALGMLGKYQAANAALALRAVEALSDRDNWAIDWDALKARLLNTKLIGRFEVIEVVDSPLWRGGSVADGMAPVIKVKDKNSKIAETEAGQNSPLEGWQSQTDGVENMTRISNDQDKDKILKKINIKTLILDGAHNPQKMNSFVTSLVEYYKEDKFDILLAFKKGKDSLQMIDELLSYKDKINSIILARFDGLQDMVIESQDTKELADYLTQKKFTIFIIEEDITKAYDLILKNTNTISVITGSLYLISAIKKIQG